MRVFLSFASEQVHQAEPIALALRNRGHSVFFSHSDLPAGQSFDERVQKAIAQSDMMVFLISPESVTKGRYTLTEMKFARDKWPDADGRILPVFLVHTSLDSVPSYLKSVTVLQPEGNVAAETGAAVDAIFSRMKSRTSAINRLNLMRFVGLALLSALLCQLSMTFLANVLPFSFVAAPDKVTIIPGVIFGTLVAGCDYVFQSRDRFQLLLVVLLTTVGWVLAFDAADLTLRSLGQYRAYSSISDGSAGTVQVPADTDADKSTSENASSSAPEAKDFPMSFYLAGMFAGAVGGGLTILGLLITNPRFRRMDCWLLTWVVAALCGNMLGVVNSLGLQHLVFLPVFAVWQAAVILSIVHGFSKAQPLELAAK